MALIHEQMLKVMQDVQSIGKDSRASMGGSRGYQFRGVDATVDALGPAMREHGVLCLPEVLDHRYSDYTTSGGAKQRDCVVLVKYHFVATDGSTVTATVAGEAADGGDKATPQAMSVAWRTCLLQSFTVPTGDTDPDHNNVQRVAPTAAPTTPMTPAPPEVDTWTAGGWKDKAQRDAQWKRSVELMGTLQPDRIGAVKEWGKEQKLSPDTITTAQAQQWFDRIQEAGAPLEPSAGVTPDESF